MLTKVGVRLAEKNIVVSANGNLAVDGQEFDVSEVCMLKKEINRYSYNLTLG